MPERVLVFLKKSVAGVTPMELQAELKDADLMTLAEVLELPEGEQRAVDTFWKTGFKLEADDASDIDGVALHFHADYGPVLIRREPPIPEELVELRRAIEGRPGADLVRETLDATVEVVEFLMGINGSHHLGATVSEVLAFFLAERGDGLVLFYGREFASPSNRGASLLALGVP